MNKIKRIVATGFFTGYCPVAPGTCGTLLAAMIYVVLACFAPQYLQPALAALIVLALAGNVWVGRWAERAFGRKDPQKVVVDEMLGYFAAVLLVAGPAPWIIAVAGFALFRLFDIAKPWPIRKCERLPAGWGVAMDDLVAGVFANVMLRLGLLVYDAVFA